MVYDVFISYRRDGGFDTAGRINDLLVKEGYSVSYDIDTLREGRFDKQLLERIEQCVDFILIVDKNAFVRTMDPNVEPQDDWLRQELAYALKLKKNIIPVLLAGADFPKGLPEDVREVSKYQGPKHTNDYFDSFYNKLKGYMHALPRNAAKREDLNRMPLTQTSTLPKLKLKPDMDCVFYLDGDEKARLRAGVIEKVPLSQGEYELRFVSVENEADVVELEFEMPENDKLQKINLSAVRDERLAKEAEAKRIAEEKAREAERKRREEEAKRRAEEEARRAEEEAREAERKRREEEARRRAEEEARQAEEKAREAERKRREEEEAKRKAEEEKRRAAEAKQDKVFDVNGVQFKMIYVQGGTFKMGATPEQGSEACDWEKPVHDVTLSDFHIGDTQVTQALWKAVMGSNPSRFRGDDLPVENVSWSDCQEFIKKLNVLTGKIFRLPTEAEWEFAARGGNKSRGYKYAGDNSIGDVAWYGGNSDNKTHPVKTKLPNELGLYDMSGNVWEWCMDWYGDYISSAQTNPAGSSCDSPRVLRGGSWRNDASYCRVAFRYYFSPSFRISSGGFRLALVHQ